MDKKPSFQEIITGEQPVLVDFFAEWCGPCKMMAPVLKDFANHHAEAIRVIKVDVDKNPSVAEHFRIQGVPTLILFKAGEPIWRQSGAVPLSFLEQAVEKALQ